jgi:O-antigen/teichoic acid export membrane protein
MSMPRSEFWKNVTTVLAGAAGGQALPLLVAPLITRLCTPAGMGAFSVWLGVITVSSTVATLRLETAMVLDHEQRQQATCFGVVAWCATLVAVGLTVVVATARVLGLPALRGMSWFELCSIGVAGWLAAYTQTLLAHAASHKLFGKAAQAKVLRGGVIAVGQLGLLYAGLDGAALMAGQLIGLAAGLWAAQLLLSPPAPHFALTLDREARGYLVKHQAFWRFSLPSSLLNTLVGQLPLFMIGMHHGALAAGLFALTQRVLSAPSAFVASSVLEVFKREAVHQFESAGNCREVYRATFKALSLLAVPPALILLLFAPRLFGWVFGPAWQAAGELARILAPLCYLNFIASPLSYVFFVAGRQKMELLWQVALFLMTASVFLAPATLQQSVLAYAIGRSVLYLVYLAMSYQCALNGRPWPEPASPEVHQK